MPEAPSPAAKMSIWEHLDELRSRVVKALLALGIGTGVAWTYREQILGWLWEPVVQSWRAQNIPGEPTLNFAAPSDAFKVYLKLSFTAELLIAAPLIFYQLWALIASGLYEKEKKNALPFVLSSTVLFVGGGLFGWRVCFPITFGYFLGLSCDGRFRGRRDPAGDDDERMHRLREPDASGFWPHSSFQSSSRFFRWPGSSTTCSCFDSAGGSFWWHSPSGGSSRRRKW